MKRAACWSYLVIVALFAALIAAPVHGGVDGSQGLELSEGQYIVVFKNTVDDPGATAKDTARKHGVKLNHIYGVALEGFSAEVLSYDLD